MYKIGELIQYGNTGVCRVADIQTRGGEGRKYYVLKPLYQDCTISTPVDNDKVFMRPILTREQAEELIDAIPTIRAEAYHTRVMRELSDHYQAAFQSHSCEDLIRLTMSIYAKRVELEGRNKKVGVIDERYMKRGEELLFGELAASLDIPADKVQNYIQQRLGDV